MADVQPTTLDAAVVDSEAPPTDEGEPPQETVVADLRQPLDLDPAGDEDAPCSCPEDLHCGPDGCVADVCLQGTTTCFDLSQQLKCSADGSTFETLPCPNGEVCYLGQCHAPICSPDDPPFCDGAERVVCNSLGLEYVPIPCPAGTGCKDGACETLQPNILLIVDTSGSMSLLADQPDTYPSGCSGPDCPAWTFPQCDSAADPKTRIARTKVAIGQFLASEAVVDTRLAMMRFPQGASASPSCKAGYYAETLGMSGDTGATYADLSWFEPNLPQILCVPFSDGPTSDLAALTQWVDFEETLVDTGDGCFSNFNCASNICKNQTCWEHGNPELRGAGPTPMGKSLFYAGEYLKNYVLVDGKPCEIDTDCGSPHYGCVDGACKDPHLACRSTAIILFTDGIETEFEKTLSFFNPRVQAKRLHYGLGCTTDADCLSGATCIAETCRFPGEDLITELQCNAFAAGCETDADCPAFQCGLAIPCAGTCEVATVQHKDPGGANTLVSLGGTPLPVTVHVVDASGFEGANELMATYGGGAFVPVDLLNIDDLVTQLVTLVDTKVGAGPCAQ